MRTKTMILSAACGLLGSLAAQADSVYSVNVVGYVNKTYTAGKFSMFVNPLNGPNAYTNLFSTLTDADYGSEIYVWDPALKTFIYAVYTGPSGGGWYDDQGNDANGVTLAPGQGAWFKPGLSHDVTTTFVGDVLTGSQSVSIVAGWTQVGSKIPQAGDITTLGLTNPNAGDYVYKYVGGDWAVWAYPGNGDNNWYDVSGSGDLSVPTLDIGEAVWYNSQAPLTWTRNFTIN